MTSLVLPAADGVGDVCQDDYDGDGVVDSEDVCPKNNKISEVDFSNMMEVNLDPNRDKNKPVWSTDREVGERR